MPSANTISVWNPQPADPLPSSGRLAHVRAGSPFAAGLLDRYPEWREGLDAHQPPTQQEAQTSIARFGLDVGLRRFRNRCMLRLIWRDLCNLATLDETFADLTSLAEVCLEAALAAHFVSLRKLHGTPSDPEGDEQHMVVIGMGKLGGGELNLSSDIDVLFCYGKTGACRSPDGSVLKRALSNEQFFTRLAQAVISSLSEVTADGFCFRVDARLRPFGDSGPLCSSMAAIEQYYQREGRDWERYALVKARPVAGDRALGQQFLDVVKPFIYRRYIDFTAVEALQDMHAQVSEDARRKERLDDVKRGPGGIREIEFLAQCFQLLRGGREPVLQSPSLGQALSGIEDLGLLDKAAVAAIRSDYVFLRRLENRIQALHDQQTHRVPQGEDLQRLVRATGLGDIDELQQALTAVRSSVSRRFKSIFPSQPERADHPKWVEVWHQVQSDQQASGPGVVPAADQALTIFLRSLERMPLSQRASRRLDRFMPVLLHRLDRLDLSDTTLNRVYDLVLAICQRSPYLVLLVQNASALDRLIELFARSEWISSSVIRFPALLDELIDPALGSQLPSAQDLQASVSRLMHASQDTESILSGLNYLKLATSLRIAVAQLNLKLDCDVVHQALSRLAEALLKGLLDLATAEVAERHGTIHGPESQFNSLAVIAYGSLGAGEPGYESDLDIIFLFENTDGASEGERSLPAERYYARIAQRLLSYLTVMTPSGRLYPVDTRLRPNGRAGALVSSLDAFAEYQLNQAWTWELQALTRARFVAGPDTTAERFADIRRRALLRHRAPDELRSELAGMRRKMIQEQTRGNSPEAGPKHRAGGLVDIEFVAQCGVLECAADHPELINTSDTFEQLARLAETSWLSKADSTVLDRTARSLHQQRLLGTLVPGEDHPVTDTGAAAAIYQRILGQAESEGDES